MAFIGRGTVRTFRNHARISLPEEVAENPQFPFGSEDVDIEIRAGQLIVSKKCMKGAGADKKAC